MTPTQITPPATSGPQPYPPGSAAPQYTDARTPSHPATLRGHTFGIPLDEVISRENATLPLIVTQCVLAVNEFGINTEGIYRVSGSATTVAKLKHLFDFEADHIDFRTPTGFFGDIHAVAGVLKQYLRELPEPILTKAFYPELMNVACMSYVRS
jgi:Rho GTPase-activating protein RGD1